MRHALVFLTALALAGCQPTPGPAGLPGGPAVTGMGSLQLTLRVPPEALPGYQTATIPGGTATIVALLSNGTLLGAPRSSTIPLVPNQTLYTVTLDSLPVGAGYTLEAEARNGSGARLAYTNQLDPAASDPALGQLRTVNPFTNPPQSFTVNSGTNNVNAGLRILPLSGTAQGGTAGSLAGNARVLTGYKRPLTIGTTPAAPLGYVCTLTLDTATLVAGAKLRADMADLHVLYWDGAKYVELFREVESPNTASSLVRFRLQKAIAASGTDANYLLTYGNAMAAAAPSDRAQVYDFYDGFEYIDAEIPYRGWQTLRGSATTISAGGQGRSGAALNLNSNTGDFLRDLVNFRTFPANFSLVAWFKDDLDTSRNDWIAPVVGNDGGGVIGIYSSVPGSNFHFFPYGGAWSDTPVARTAGWHRYEFRRVGSTMTYLIDGVQVGGATDARAHNGIMIRSGGSAGVASNAYWDDITLRQYQTPEPTVTPGGEQAL